MRRWLWAVGVLLVVGCNPGVDHDSTSTANSGTVVARFDPSTTPPTAPAPNDLAIGVSGTVQVPVGPGASAADQALASYFQTLHGFAASSVPSTTFTGNIDVSSVTTQTVVVWDITGATPIPVSGYLPTVRNSLGGAAAAELDIAPPIPMWTPGHGYAVFVIGGSKGVQGSTGGGVFGSPAWLLVRSPAPLVKCGSNGCVPTTNLIPSTVQNPQARAADQLAKAQALEQVRLGYAPLLSALEAQGVKRQDVAIAWTFHVTAQDFIAYSLSGAVPEVPTPNDLAIDPTTHLVSAPADPRTPAANQEFVTTYLNTLPGFPIATPAAALVVGPEPLNAATVSGTSVVVLDVTLSGAGPFPPPTVATVYDSVHHEIIIAPTSGAWTRGHHYAAVILGGSTGIAGADSSAVLPDTAWVLLRGTAPLVDCQTLSASCHSVVSAIPLGDSDAIQIETARRQLAPVLDAFEQLGITRENMLAGWTFQIVAGSEPTFDLTQSIIPFPNDLVRAVPTDGGSPHVNLPIPNYILPDGGVSAALYQQAQLTIGLNTLDGFSTTAPIVSQNSLTSAALTQGGHIDPSTLAGNAMVVRMAGGYSTPLVKPCLNDLPADAGCSVYFSLLPDGGQPQNPEALILAPQVPLDERTLYAAYLTTDIKDTAGHAIMPPTAFALLKLSNPLVAGGHSTVQGVDDASATQLEPLRQQMQPLLQALGPATTQKLALAWSFTTQSEISTLQGLHAVPFALPAQAAQIPTLFNATTFLQPSTSPPYPTTGGPNVGPVFIGEMVQPYLLQGPGGVLADPTQVAPASKLGWFHLFLPASTKPATGYPVAIFGHGLGTWRGTLFAIADRLAKDGIASIAVDDPFHGDRSSCAGAASAIPLLGGSDNNACAVGTCDENTSSPTYGRCVGLGGDCDPTSVANAAGPGIPADVYCAASLRQGRCLNTGGGSAGFQCEGGDFLREGDLSGGANPFDTDWMPVISGWNFLDTTNLFRTRDDFRQVVVDYAQVAKVISTAGAGTLNNQLTAALSASGPVLDATKIQFLGQSLGGLTGTLYNSVAPETHNVVLNVPAGDLALILLTSPTLIAEGITPGFINSLASIGITRGSPVFDQFIGLAKWIVDPADPVNMAYGLQHQILTGPQIATDRRSFIYFIDQDQFLPNPATFELIAAANRAGDQNICSVNEEFPTTGDVPLPNRHGFLLSPASTANGPAFTAAAQTKAVTFVSSGNGP